MLNIKVTSNKKKKTMRLIVEFENNCYNCTNILQKIKDGKIKNTAIITIKPDNLNNCVTGRHINTFDQ